MSISLYKKAMHILNLLNFKVDEAIQKLETMKNEEDGYGLGKEGVGFAKSNDGIGLGKSIA